jgi:hypothetical protein
MYVYVFRIPYLHTYSTLSSSDIEDIDIFHYTYILQMMMTIRIELIQSSYIAIIFTVLCWVAASEEAVPRRVSVSCQSFRSI